MPRSRIIPLFCLTLGLTLALPALTTSSASAAVTETVVTDASTLAQSLAGPGVVISNATRTGGPTSTGTFTNGADVVGFDDGITLGTGAASIGSTNASTQRTLSTASGSGDADLNTLGVTTRDTSSLEFDVTPNSGTLYFNYVFASEEYNEYVASTYNDVFAFFVTNGAQQRVNCAVVPDGPDAGTDPDPVSVNTINGGHPLGNSNASNPQLFRDNDPTTTTAPIAAEPDGFTTVLRCEASVTPLVANHIKLAISDVGDQAYDSWVFVQAGSVSTAPVVPVTAPPTTTPSSPPATQPVPVLPGATGAGKVGGKSIGFTASRSGGDVRVRKGRKLLTSASVESFVSDGSTATWSGSCLIRRRGSFSSRATGCRYTVRVVDGGTGPDHIVFTVKRPKRSGLSFSGTLPAGSVEVT